MLAGTITQLPSTSGDVKSYEYDNIKRGDFKSNVYAGRHMNELVTDTQGIIIGKMWKASSGERG